MALVTTPGASDADSYVSAADCETYCTARGLTFAAATSGADAALRRATQAIDARYKPRFPGQKWKLRDQALEWPRTTVTDVDGLPVDYQTIPREIVQATCEAAVRELAAPNSMLPDLKRGGDIKSIQAGSVGIVYGDNASARTTFQLIDGILYPLIGSGNSLFAMAERC